MMFLKIDEILFSRTLQESKPKPYSGLGFLIMKFLIHKLLKVKEESYR